MRTIFDIGDKVEFKLIGTIRRIEISDKDEDYEIAIQRHPRAPQAGYAIITLSKDQLMLMNALNTQKKEGIE